MIKISKDFLDFNKEIIFGEIGAVVGAQITSIFVSNITSSPSTISLWVVIGSIIGASLFWGSMRIYDKIKLSKNKFSGKKFLGDIAYFTPVAFIFTLLIYYPSLYYFSKKFISEYNKIIFPVFFSQLGAFILLLISLNFYKYILFKVNGRKL